MPAQKYFITDELIQLVKELYEQIDHIIPQSDLPYSSMEDDNFKKCWSLDNLRPYSSKLNNIDGINRIRHKTA